MNIPDDILKETVLEDGSELKVTENSLLHIQNESDMEVTDSIMSDFSPSSQKDNSLTDISLESVDMVQYSSQLRPQLTVLSISVFALSFLVSLFFWYQFGINGFALHWALGAIISVMVGMLLGWFLRDYMFVEEATVQLSSGEKLEFVRNVEEAPENAQLQLLWVMQEVRQRSH